MQIGEQFYPFACWKILDGTFTVTAVATTMVAISTKCRYVEVTASSANTEAIFVGNGTSQNRQLVAGQPVRFSLDDLIKVYTKSSGTSQSAMYFGVE